MWLLEFAREGGRLLQALKRKLGSSGWDEVARRFKVANHDAAQGECDSIELKEFDGSRLRRREVDGPRLRRKLGASSLGWRKLDGSRRGQREPLRPTLRNTKATTSVLSLTKKTAGPSLQRATLF